MKILVPTKRVPDTDQKIAVHEDGVAIDDAHLPYIVNPFDAIALEEAVRIREGGPLVSEAAIMKNSCARRWPWAPTGR